MQRLLNNWKLKVLSLVLAVVLWSHVRGEVNPWETASFRVPLNGAAPSHLLVLNREKIPREVRVTLRAPRSRLRELKGFAPPNPLAPDETPTLNTGDVRASLDFSLARLGTQDVPVETRVAIEDAEFIAVKPSDIVVQLDQASQQERSIEAQIAPARGYLIDGVRLGAGSATIFGPSKALGRVRNVRAVIRSGPLALGVAKRIAAPLEAVDEEGDKVPEVVVEPPTVGAFATLRQEIIEKEVPLQARLVNAPPGDVLGAPEVIPERLKLRGPLLELEKIGALRVPLDADLAQRQGAFLQRRVAITLPPRVLVLAQGSSQDVGEVLVRAPLRSQR
jgi:YbbR domain-containing protein